ncbi:MAG: 1-deoxy-D-xylulose-5-phosphate synthase [Lachnospiraceae bacterium]|nr:1-deoxy-D-xylulose-5-phosphate synthase [Lachnospiraceae bacterium]
MLLENINQPNDIKNIDKNDYGLLADEIREYIIEKVSDNGGHLASNLGVVELTMALHLILDFPKDKIVWDVGHQSYTHKILTGRKEDFNTLRAHGGLSGFPKRRESECDCFNTGHSSTSISAGLGIVTANEINGGDDVVVSVIGDGALTGGLAYEALNNASRLKRNFIIILNDNEMSISENVGGVSKYLSGIRTGQVYNEVKSGVTKTLNSIPVVGEKIVHHISKTKSSIKQLVIPGMFFENMGITYLGPIDGHNISQMIRVFNEAKKLNHAVIVHVITKKGKGYELAEKRPSKFHGIDPFDIETGKTLETKSEPTYTDVFSKTICRIAKQNKNVVAITAAMADGTGLKRFKSLYPERFFDVGIAEEHAVTFAAGLAATGFKPYVAVYSSFLQRAYDQILHDVCIQSLPVVFAIDRAGIVGNDGETHQGIYDISFLRTIPNLSIFAPKNRYEFVDILKFSSTFDAPLAIRYPKGTAGEILKEYKEEITFGKSEVIFKEKDIAIIACGSMIGLAIEVREKLKSLNYNCSIVNARFIKPIDEKCIDMLKDNHRVIVTIEENILNGGYGEAVLKYVNSMNYNSKVVNIGIPNMYLEHGNIDLLKKEVGLSLENVTGKILEVL